MRIAESRSDHLTYCTNIHPGESLSEVRENLERYVLEVKAGLGLDTPFGVGLRLSALAAQELEHPGALAEFREFLAAHSLYVFTLNGFPYGPFHGQPVKERVYAPDWLEGQRLSYTTRLAKLLGALLPDGVNGSVSTLPGGFRPCRETPGAQQQIALSMLSHVLELWQLAEASGHYISLALEPEPHCLLETTAEAVQFLEEYVLSREAVDFVMQRSGMHRTSAEEAVRAHIGLCLDACHAAVEFEEPAQSVATAREAGIQIAKAQLSSGLELLRPDIRARDELRAFDDPVYLHQTVIRRVSDDAEAHLIRLLDLPEALARPVDPEHESWRVHCHVPIFLERLERFDSTQSYLRGLLEIQRQDPFTEHLEVETYTWDVLPEALRTASVSEAIVRELTWAREQLC